MIKPILISWEQYTDDPVIIILVDTEQEIVEGDSSYGLGGLQSKVTLEMLSFDWNKANDKIISSTNKSHNLPQLSPHSIQLLIKYYNEHKCMPKSIEMEEETINLAAKGNSSSKSIFSNCHNWVTRIKLNKKGEVDITIPEVGKCPVCGASNPDWARVCQYPRCQTSLNKPLPKVEEKLYTEEEVVKLLDSFQDDLTMLGEIKGYNTEIWFNYSKK